MSRPQKSKSIIMKKSVLTMMTLMFTTILYARGPILRIVPVKPGANHAVLNPVSTYVLDYLVTNTSPKLHSAVYVPVPSVVQQNVPGQFNCGKDVQLSAGQHCLLRLVIDAMAVSKNNAGQKLISGGPVAAVDGSYFSMYQPSAEDSLDVTVNDAPIALVANVPSLALSVNNTSLNAALTGNPRSVVFTNEGSSVANNVTYTLSPSLPSDASVSETYTPYNSSSIGSCSQLYPGDTCTITITPGATSTTAVTLTAASDTYTASSMISILSYGSFYQTGYVFSIDDTVSSGMTSASVGGTVVAESLQATTGVNQPWSQPSNASGDYYPVCGIYQTTTAGQVTCPAFNGSFAPDYYPTSYLSYTSCNGATDGSCNTTVLVGAAGTSGNTGSDSTFNGVYPSNATAYSAAGLCRSYSTTDTNNTVYNDWYLPSICELGYQQRLSPLNSYTSGCSQTIEPAPNDTVVIQNIQSSLLDPNPQPIPADYVENFTFINLFWSSTEFDGTPFLSGYNCNDVSSGELPNTSPCATDVWYNEFNNNHSTDEATLAEQNIDNKGDISSVVICVRAMTQPS